MTSDTWAGKGDAAGGCRIRAVGGHRVVGVLERLSDRTRRVLELARAEAARLGHHHVGTEHLLLGLLAEADTGAARTLVAAGATLDGARGKVAEAVGPDDGRNRGDEPQYTARAARALERANRLSLQRRDEYLEPELVLLSVIDVEGTAGQVLRVLGVDVVALRHAVDLDAAQAGGEDLAPVAAEPRPPRLLRSGPVEPSAAAAGVGPDGAAGPRCPDCRTSLDGALAYRLLAATGEPAPRPVIVVYCAVCGAALGASAEGPAADAE